MPSKPVGLWKHNKTGVFWIRRRVPADVKAVLGLKLYQETLGTKDYRTAEALFHERMSQILQTWRAHAVRRDDPSKKMISALAGEFCRSVIAKHENEPGDPKVWQAEIDRITERRVAGSRQIGGTFGSRVTGEMQKFLVERGFGFGSRYPETVRAFYEAKLLALKTLIRMAKGDYFPDPLVTGYPALVQTHGALGPLANNAQYQPLLIETEWQQYATDCELAASTEKRWKPLLLNLSAFVGGGDLARVTPEQVVRWTEHLAREVDGKRLSKLTIADAYLASAKNFFSWALSKKRWIKENPCTGIVVRRPKKRSSAPEQITGFTKEEANLILSEALRPADARASHYWAAARRWVPWICAYTGARVNEVTQLRAIDVMECQVETRTVYVLRITPDAGTVKGNIARDVPLHQHLVDQGFIQFARRSHGTTPLFYDPVKSKGTLANPPYRKVGDKLGAWVRAIGVDRDVAPNHGWRHGFNASARIVRMVPEIRDHITGHAPRTVGEGYGHFPLASVIAELDLLPSYEVAVPTTDRPQTTTSKGRSAARASTAKRAKARAETIIACGAQVALAMGVTASTVIEDEADPSPAKTAAIKPRTSKKIEAMDKRFGEGDTPDVFTDIDRAEKELFFETINRAPVKAFLAR